MNSNSKFAELHIHIEGSLEPDFLVELSKRNDFTLPTMDFSKLKELYNFRNLTDFLKTYYSSMMLLKTEKDYEELGNRYFERVSKTDLSRAEIFFDPQTHKDNANEIDKVLNGLVSSLKTASDKYSIDAKLIMCFERDRGADAAMLTLDALLEYLDQHEEHRKYVIGVGLDSVEKGNPPHVFKKVYEKARAQGLNLTAHAGEEAGAGFIWESLDELGVSRIDHGVQAINDEALISRLASEQIPLTCCPLSNYALKGKPTLKAAVDRVIALLDKGLLVTVNSDDPAYFGGYIDDNYAAIKECGYDDDVINQLKRNSLTASWTS